MCSQTVVDVKSSCDSNLHVIARKLSETLRKSAPCEECANLPAELMGAAKCIKDLSDLVQSHKVRGDGEDTDRKKRKEKAKAGATHAPPEMMDEATQCTEGQRGGTKCNFMFCSEKYGMHSFVCC